MSPTASSQTLRVALVQLRSGRDVAANIASASDLIRQAAEAGAHYVQTPEMTNLMELDRALLLQKIRTPEADPALAAFQALARDLSIHLHVGSLALKVSDQKAVNQSVLIAPNGEISARYDKIHMFDVDLAEGESYRESSTFKAGERAVVGQVEGIGFGLTICYDLRFPALYRALAEAGARVLTIPAAFTRFTGEAHWHVLVRARAIENGAYVLAATQGGRHENGRETYGHAMVVDPWGRVIAEGGTDPGVILADLDMSAVDMARQRVPALTHGRRFEVAQTGQSGHLHLVGAPT